MNYFDSDYVSNSDLKELRKRVDPKFEEPPNLKEIFIFGHLVEDCIFHPAAADYTHPKIELAKAMAIAFHADKICRTFLMVNDFRRQHEWYRSDRFGLRARCKADGDSRQISSLMEFKGLSVDSDSQFEECIDRFDYDQALSWYLDLSGYNRMLLVAGSKKSPDRLFKRIVDRDHKIYKRGLDKVHSAVRLWNQYFG